MAGGAARDENNRVIATNRPARHNFFIEDTFECGIMLRGSEVKSLRESKVQITDAFGHLDGGELWLHNLHIAPYSHSQRHTGHDPVRRRKLLLHRREIDRISARMRHERLSLVPMQLYFKDGKAKLELGLGKGKKNVDKRQDIAKRDAARDTEREMGRALKTW
jgi:SsrA-binding protein